MTHRVSLAALLAVLPATTLAAGAAERGVYWEQTIEMQMMGFAMPPQTIQVCMPKGQWDAPPEGGQQGDCTMTELKRSGSRFTWKVKCSDGTTGTGEMTYGPDRLQGTTTMNRQGQAFTMNIKGRKLGGDCDLKENERRANEMRGQFEAQQTQQAEMQAQGCAQSVERMEVSSFYPPAPGAKAFCADQTRDFCRRLETRQGLVAFRQANGYEGARGQAEKICRKRLGDVEAKLCADAAKEQAQGRKLQGDAVEFVFASCPDQAKAIAKTECAGRSYTSMPSAQRDFCTRYARERLDRGEAAPAAQEAPLPAPASDMKQSIMRGIFGR